MENTQVNGLSGTLRAIIIFWFIQGLVILWTLIQYFSEADWFILGITGIFSFYKIGSIICFFNNAPWVYKFLKSAFRYMVAFHLVNLLFLGGSLSLGTVFNFFLLIAVWNALQTDQTKNYFSHKKET